MCQVLATEVELYRQIDTDIFFNQKSQICPISCHSGPFWAQIWPPYTQESLPGMSNLASKLGQIDPQKGQIWDFLRPLSVHFGSPIWPNWDAKFSIPGAGSGVSDFGPY